MAWPAGQEEGFQPEFPLDPPFLASDSLWVDSLMQEMKLEDRIAQMMMVQAYSNMGEAHTQKILHEIRRNRVGGIAFFQGDPLSQARLTNLYQENSKWPLLVAIDGESGLGFRLKNTISYPPQMALGAISDESLIFRMGQDIGSQMKRLGVQLNFAPVADVNNNPANPVINTRSFGEDPENVSRKIVSLVKGMQTQGLLVAAKHFPGHGDTDADSHHALPELPHARQRLDSVELRPFRDAIAQGLTGIMVAHLQVPRLDSRPYRPATVSAPVVNDLLREELGFKGLVITDALNMKGLSRHYPAGRAEIEAIKAGNDILLMPYDVELAIREIKRAIRQGELSEERINASCRRILLAKYWSGLAGGTTVRLEGLEEDLHRPEYLSLYRELIAASLTLVKNKDSILPLRKLEKWRMATVTLTQDGRTVAGRLSDRYLEGDHFSLSKQAGAAERASLIRNLEAYNLIIVHVRNTSSYPSRNYGISRACSDFIAELPAGSRVILNIAGYPYALGQFASLDGVDAILLSYSDREEYQDYAVQAIFGGRPFMGRLPVSVDEHVRAGSGIQTAEADRLGFSSPIDEGLHPDTLARMDELIARALEMKAMPGCQLLVARRGKVVWNKSYGYHSYRQRREVGNGDIYDLASITKIAATMPALIRLRDQGLFHEDSALGSYTGLTAGSDKDSLIIGNILAHQAGLQAWIPFYQKTIEPIYRGQSLVRFNRSWQYPLKIGPSEYANKDVRYLEDVYAEHFSSAYPIRVADHLFLRRDYRDSLFSQIAASPLSDPEYLYSDLGFYYFPGIVEALSDTLFYPYVWYNFYRPMGASSLGFLPLERFPRSQIVPTENDLFFRRQLLQGHVHDPGAAMLGGISGHAGLFGNALDLAKLMQMYLNGGTYGGERYLDAGTIAQFTRAWDPAGENRRGLGFDRPIVDEDGAGPACDAASARSFGHSGFTGTLAWVDPEHELVFIFLSNRIHPGQGNTTLIDENIRTGLQQIVYDALRD